MPETQLVPAAQYLRMSTEHQQYSLENQSAAIAKYAQAHGFEIVRTYFDAAKSGLILRRRAGLQQLLSDVVGGAADYRSVLVYDVSRWGRFQDTDESAHYEFLCKAAGVPVHYCAETFANDGTLPSLIMKALKRTMAGEYSRELGVKIVAGQRRLAQLGFKQGGRPGYGLRRMLISPTGTPKQQLEFGERKSLTTDRVVLVPGPDREVECVREIYRMLISEKRTVYAIARELNQRGVEYTPESEWDYMAVYNVLTHPKYCGCHVFGRTSSRLYAPKVKEPQAQWVVKPNAFAPIIDAATFENAQKILGSRASSKSNQDFLDGLRALLAAKGKLTRSIIDACDDVPSPSTYIHRFGSLQKAYKLIGYGTPEQFGRFELRRRTQALRRELMEQIVATFPNSISIDRPGAKWRGRLRIRKGRMISVLVVRSVRVWKDTVRWLVVPVLGEQRLVTLLARLDHRNEAIMDFHVFPSIDRKRRFYISLEDQWLKSGNRFRKLSEFSHAVAEVVGQQPQLGDRM